MIVIDVHEKGSIVPAQLEKLKVPLTYAPLEVGDYLIENSICVERKDIGDFLGSLLDGRLNNQLYNMSFHYSRAFLLVEGFIDEVLWMRKIKRHAYLSALAGACTKTAPDGQSGAISIVMTSSPYDSALFLYYVHEKIISGEYRQPTYNPLPKKKVPPILNVVQSLPGVGEKKSEKLLTHFKSIEAIVKASVDELSPIVGPKAAQEIYDTLHTPLEATGQ